MSEIELIAQKLEELASKDSGGSSYKEELALGLRYRAIELRENAAIREASLRNQETNVESHRADIAANEQIARTEKLRQEVLAEDKESMRRREDALIQHFRNVEEIWRSGLHEIAQAVRQR
jgi:hypothetical protein